MEFFVDKKKKKQVIKALIREDNVTNTLRVLSNVAFVLTLVITVGYLLIVF